MTRPATTAGEVLAFWREAGPARWFRKDDGFDDSCRGTLAQAHDAATRGELAGWADTPEGALALLILLDQFPRNAFRDTERMYATDALAREVARRAVQAGLDVQAEPELRRFFYLPFMHSELLADQDESVALNTREEGEALRYALHHRDIIRKFGRFPHRNAVLGRASTPEEQQFLGAGGFTG